MTLETFIYPNLSGIPTDYVPVTTDDDNDNTGNACVGLYIEGGGELSVQFRNGPSRAIIVPDHFILPGRVTRVRSTIAGSGTAAANIYALIG